MKKAFTSALICVICFLLILGTSGCGTPGTEVTDSSGINNNEESTPAGKEPDSMEAATNETPETEAPEPVTEPVSLDGKKVIIIGNSYVYSGKMVDTVPASQYTQAARKGDKGYFYQLCKANGQEVNVTNWTFPGHSLSNLFKGNCGFSSCPAKNENHEKHLTDRYYDYVIVSPSGGSSSAKTILTDFDYIIRFFKKANPDVKIVCLANLGVHGYSSYGTDFPEVYNNYKAIEEKGVIIADWGGLVARILKGIYTVPGATEEYTQNTFIIKDGYHPNALAGYITTLVAYCAVTGEKAEGQPYDFYDNTSLNSTFNMTTYVTSNYIRRNTNFTRVFESAEDMKGLQQLTDKYLKEKPYLTPWNKDNGDAKTQLLEKEPENGIISIVFSETKPEGNGWMAVSSKWKKPEKKGYSYFSGLRGDADAICSLEGTIKASGLTDAQKTDLADIRYGLSAIGISRFALEKYYINEGTANQVESTSLANLVNGHYGSTYLAQLYFGSKTYNIKGEEDESSPYTALITLNFGSEKTFEAIGYASGNMREIPCAQDVFVSSDGINWTKVESACYDKEVTTLHPITEKTSVKDPWNNNTPSYETLFSMNMTKGKYIRIGIIKGANASYTGVNIRELMVFGK